MPYRIRPLNAWIMASSLCLSAPLAQAQPSPTFPSTAPAAPQSKPVKDRYIVVFKKDLPNPQAEAAAIMRGIQGARVHRSYGKAIKGFSATLPEQALAGIRRNPNVAYIEQDMMVSVNQAASPQNQATWGLDRIDQSDRPLDSQYRFNHTGRGVYAFIIDSGIRLDHEEFKGRMVPGMDAIDEPSATTPPGNDCSGHGTHVAGTVGGSTWGVAKQVQLVPVRVLGCDQFGTLSSVLAGLDWVAASTHRPAVATLSIDGSLSTALNEAIEAVINTRVTVVAAAGNRNIDACERSPASAPNAITVGATTTADQRASYSNHGRCVDVFAPGTGITSASHTSSTASAIKSGTSMAVPHVAGVAALLLEQNPKASAGEISHAILQSATENRLSELTLGSPNKLLYSLANLPQAASVVAVSAIQGSSSRVKSNWYANATVTVGNLSATGAPVAGATVQAVYEPGGPVSCVTDSTGTCSFNSMAFRSRVEGTTLSVTRITGDRLMYDALKNTTSAVRIVKP